MPSVSSLSAPLKNLLARMGFGRGGYRREMLGDLASPGLVRRDVRVFLPPGFKRGMRAPLLIGLDGQFLARWKLVETLDRLTVAGMIEPPVVATIPASAERLEEFATAGVLDYEGRGKLAGKFQDYLATALLPALRSRYGAGFEPAKTGIFGASLGGLSAFDVTWRHPDCFGFAGIFSGSFWWRTDDSDPEAQQNSRIVHQRVRESAVKPDVRFWFQAGTEDEIEDRDGNGVIDAIQDTTELIDELESKGFQRGHDLTYVETSGGHHDHPTWARELPAFLQWALPPRR
jgi:iron(III)-enterobactin esterase